MRKRILSLILVISIISSFMLSLSVVANTEIVASGTCGDNLTWKIDNDGVLVISGSGNMYNYYNYQAHNDAPWWSFRKNIKEIYVKNDVKSIGDYAFDFCGNLVKVSLPDSLTSIGCYSFRGCYELENITLPNSLINIGDSAFFNDLKLKSIDIPESVVTLGNQVFDGCWALTDIYVDKNNRHYSSIDGVLFNKEHTTLIQYAYGKTIDSYVIPSSVQHIENAAFHGCELKNIVIPNSVVSIGEEAFMTCERLTSIVIPNGISNIPRCAFLMCYNITSITIPKSVTEFGSQAFQYCDSLKDVYYAGSKEEWDAIYMDAVNNPLKNATIHYNYISVDKSKQSNSTSDNAPVIKSVELEYNNTCYDIVNQKVTVDVGSSKKANLTVNMDLKSALKPRVYITQGADTDLNDGNGMSLSFNNTDGKWKDITLGEKLKPDLPVYIFVIDEITGQSTSVLTKLNMVDLSADDDFKRVQEIGEIKIGKDMMLTIPEDVPIIGGTELTWQFDFLPVSMTCADDKMSFALGLDLADYNDGSDKDKKEGFDFKGYRERIDDYVETLDKYDEDILEAYKKQNLSLSELKKQVLSESDLAKNKGLNMSAFGNKPFVNTGSDKLGGGIEALGYVEVNKKNGEWDWNSASGHLIFQLNVSYTYNGQAFFYVIPLCYSFGGEASAGFKGEVKGMSTEGYQPYIEAYLMAKLKLFVSGGVGVSKVANFSAKANGELSLNYGLSDTATKPDELLLDGSVNFFVEVLGQKVASLEVANLNDKYGVIYSTDPDKYDQSWIKPNSVSAVSLMSIDEQLGNYSANNVYENESREYLANSMEWYGDMPPISLFAADYTNKDLTILADSVYPQAQPQIFSVGGKKILVFTADNDTRAANNKQMLVYSVYNDEDGTWSEAVPVADDGTADFYPSVCGEYLVWQNQKSVIGDGLSLAEIGKQGEIIIAKWNGNGFDAPVSLTDNDALDTLPKVSVNGNEISIVWLKNSANDILGVDGNTSIIKKVYNGSTWDEEVVLKDSLNAVTDLSVGYSENALNVAYVHDVDDDITTIDDREVYLIGSSEKQVTDNKVLDSNAIINNGKLYWYSENNIHFMNLADGTESTVFEDARYALADGFTVSEDNGNIAILWSGSEDAGSEIKGVLYQNGAWGDVITVSELSAYAKYPTCVLEEDGTILTSFTAEADGITSLYTLGLFPSYDLAISDIYFDEKNLALNSENEFDVMVINNGELPVEGYTINVYNEDETLNNSIVFEDAIKAGESKAVVGKFITGDAISYETLKIEIALNADEEYVYDNNSVTLSIGNGDISLESLSVYEMLPTSYAVADVKNIGYSDISNITVNLRKDSVDGEIVQSKTVSSLAACSNEEVTFAYKPQGYENVKWFVTVEVEADEVSVGNNYDYFINECAVGLEDYEISILNYSYADKQLTVNAFAKNNTNDTLTADAVFAVYSSDGRMKGVTSQPLNVGGYSDTGIDVWFENYTYASGDYVKMFMWNGINNLKPMVNAEQVNVNCTP